MTDLLAAYAAAGPGHDEMLQASGAARTAWDRLAARAHLGNGEELAARAEEVTSLLADHGATAPGTGDAWQLDPLPVLLDEVEWTRLEDAVRQRTELLDAVLADLYGPRRLLSSGILPPELVLSHPGFVRAADGIRLPGAHQLVVAGADVARNADGSWVVITDHAQAPSGMGHAMEDRRVVSQVLAGLYRHSRIRRIGPFFHALGQALAGVAPEAAGDGARVALLTSGPSSPTAFDEGYLAAMLGIPLVQGTDLVVEDGRVWARALDGRAPVDVLLRRVDARDCDPLELRGGTGLGTPGLVQAARTGTVSVVNPFGSGALENPALLTYLPRLSRALRDEELTLGSAVTYWCGERSMCSHVIANLARLVIKPIGSAPGSTVHGWELTNGERADLAVQISHRPWAWVGQEPVEASTTPTVEGRGLRAYPTVLRTFAVARGETYDVMAGALGRVTPDGGRSLSAPHPAGAAKDVWVLSAEPYAAAESWPGEPELLPRRAEATGIAPRAARELFRLGRATERAEGTARLLRAVADRRDDEGTTTRPGAQHGADPGAGAVPILLAALRGEPTGIAGAAVDLPGDAPAPPSPARDLPLSQVVTDPAVPGTIAHAVAAMVRSAASVRDLLSPDTWLALSSLERTLALERRRRAGSEADTEAELGLGPVLGRVLEGLLALSGVFTESMVHDVGWTLLEVGRRLERAQHLVAVLAATVTTRHEPAVDALVQRSVLSAHESVLTHRRRYPGQPPLRGMLELLLLDGANPRSLAFQLDRIGELLADLPAVSRGPQSRDQLLADVVDLLTEMPLDAVVAEAGPGGERTRLAETLTSMAWRLQSLGAEITAVHLTSPRPAQWPGEVWTP
ncbi:circularly permuted type 2 ATP-grasp protein [Georgenia sp. MJ206]|uniref:circularly permuted type 2 ATP-grasp protein n=1 Tax=Georgenia wangjunii TaxID=3117730 RepID=UPI002F2685C1